MNRLQLSNQLQNQCNNIEIAFAGADMILIVHIHVWPEIRPLGFKGLMIKRLLELRNSIEELEVLSPEFHLSTATWLSLNEVFFPWRSVGCNFKTSSRRSNLWSFYERVVLFKTYTAQKTNFTCIERTKLRLLFT